MKSIEVKIAGRAYPLKVTDTEEESVTRVVEEVNRTVNEYQHTYRQKDKQDCLAMALLVYALEAGKAKNKSEISDEIVKRSLAIDQKLDQLLAV